jgi:Tfp pilus assembly protein PilE
MISIAILFVIITIAIPAYTNYTREAHFATIRTTIQGMRTAIEEYRLENGDYGTVDTLIGIANIQARFDWQPAGDIGDYEYTVVINSTDDYDVYGQFGGSGVWARCDNRYQDCCDSDTKGSMTVVSCD